MKEMTMSRRLKHGILLIALAQLFLTLGVLALPRLVQALPGEYRVRLAQVPAAESLLRLGETPMPTALPAPQHSAGNRSITIPALATPTATVTALPTATASVGDSSGSNEPTLPAATPTTTPTATVTPKPLPRQARLEGLEIIPQGFNNCGPANLAINLNFWGNPTTQDDAAAYLKPNREDRNTSPWQLSDYVNQFTDLRSTAHSGGDLQLLKRLIAAGFPVVIEKGYELPREGWLGHYLTIFGYDDDKEEMVSMDTNLGPWDGSGRYDSYADIEHYWQQFNYTFFVVYPTAREQEVFAILGEGLLDQETMWRAAAEKAQAEIEVDAQNAFAWFNLGTSLTRLGEMTGQTDFYENGAAAFDEARSVGLPPRMLWYQFRPYMAYMKLGRYQDMLDLAESTLSTQGGRNVEETYLYQGHALLFTGDVEGAVAAYEQALKLNENFYPAQWALDSLDGS
jgi:hypothetical protein